MDIGNISEADKLVPPAEGYKFGGGKYAWQDEQSSGREVTGVIPSQSLRLSPVPGHRHWWYDATADVYAYIIYEDYGQGQSSTAYFVKESK